MRSTARRRSGYRRKSNPKNMRKVANFKQANRKGARKQMMLRRQPVVETKQRVEADMAFINGHNTETDWENPLAYRPISLANAFTLLPIECFTRQSQGFQEYNMIGSCITSRFLKTKIDFRFPYNNFVANKNDADMSDPNDRSKNMIINGPVRLYMICGWVTNPTNFPVNPPDIPNPDAGGTPVPQVRADTATQADLTQHIINELKPYFDDRSDKLSFRPKETTNIKIESYRRIKPALTTAIGSAPTPEQQWTSDQPTPIMTRVTGHGSVPNVHRTHNFKCPGKITYTLGQPSYPPNPVGTPPQADTQNWYLNNNWLPFVMIYNPDYEVLLEQYAGDKGNSDCPITSGPPGPDDCPLEDQYDSKVCWIEYRYNSAHYFTDS